MVSILYLQFYREISLSLMACITYARCVSPLEILMKSGMNILKSGTITSEARIRACEDMTLE